MRHYRSLRLKNWQDHPNYNCRIRLDDNREFLIYANWLHNEYLDQWQGWTCLAGARRLYIDKNLNVWSGECRNDFLGSASDEFNLLESTVCKQETCSGCTDDLLVAKTK